MLLLSLCPHILFSLLRILVIYILYTSLPPPSFWKSAAISHWLCLSGQQPLKYHCNSSSRSESSAVKKCTLANHSAQIASRLLNWLITTYTPATVTVALYIADSHLLIF